MVLLLEETHSDASCTIESVLAFCITGWEGNLRHLEKECINVILWETLKTAADDIQNVKELHVVLGFWQNFQKGLLNAFLFYKSSHGKF